MMSFEERSGCSVEHIRNALASALTFVAMIDNGEDWCGEALLWLRNSQTDARATRTLILFRCIGRDNLKTLLQYELRTLCIWLFPYNLDVDIYEEYPSLRNFIKQQVKDTGVLYEVFTDETENVSREEDTGIYEYRCIELIDVFFRYHLSFDQAILHLGGDVDEVFEQFPVMMRIQHMMNTFGITTMLTLFERDDDWLYDSRVVMNKDLGTKKHMSASIAEFIGDPDDFATPHELWEFLIRQERIGDNGEEEEEEEEDGHNNGRRQKISGSSSSSSSASSAKR